MLSKQISKSTTLRGELSRKTGKAEKTNSSRSKERGTVLTNRRNWVREKRPGGEITTVELLKSQIDNDFQMTTNIGLTYLTPGQVLLLK